MEERGRDLAKGEWQSSASRALFRKIRAMTMLSMSHEDGSHPTGRTKFRVETIRVSHKGIGTDQRNRNSTQCGMFGSEQKLEGLPSTRMRG